MTVVFFKDPFPLIEVLIKKKVICMNMILLLENEYKMIQSILNDDLSKFGIEKLIKIFIILFLISKWYFFNQNF